MSGQMEKMMPLFRIYLVWLGCSRAVELGQCQSHHGKVGFEEHLERQVRGGVPEGGPGIRSSKGGGAEPFEGMGGLWMRVVGWRKCDH